MIRIVENGKVKSLQDFPEEFIRTVSKIDDLYERHGLKLEEITIIENTDGEKECDFIWECDLRLLGF